MDKLVIEGRHALRGTIEIGGSKNTALALMTGALLADGTTTLTNVPVVRDVRTLSQILEFVGATVGFDPSEGILNIDATALESPVAPYELVKKMRASFYMLGALLGRSGRARVSLPGGCAWGPRPVNLHMDGIKALGASIDLDEGYVVARAPEGRLPGGTFRLEPSSVGATINLLLAAATARGGSRIENAAREPDVVVFGQALQAMGARINGLGTETIEVEGVDRLEPVTFRNCSDRIELGTFMIAAAMAGEPGRPVTLTQAEPEYLGKAFVEAFEATGAGVAYMDDRVEITAPDRLRSVSIETGVYPGFPTDLQAQWCVFMAGADGTSLISESIYLDRFKHIPELQRMGLSARLKPSSVEIEGGRMLKGAKVMSSDLRASVSLVLAGLIAEGETHVLRIYHLDRGYEHLERKFAAAGIPIRRESYDEFAAPALPDD